jgi:hypothetical protein
LFEAFVKALLKVFLMLCLFWVEPVLAQSIVVHHLTVAANSSLFVTDNEVGKIIVEMNRVIAAKSYPWDVSCPVEFERQGSVISDPNLATSGTYDELKASRARYAPSANVLVVLSLKCSTGVDLGCDDTWNEPIVSKSSPPYDALVWLHERGHSVGLPHSADAPFEDTNAPNNEGYRFMFWRIGASHVGKTVDECSHFENSNLPSVTRTAGVAVPAIPSNPLSPRTQFAQGLLPDSKVTIGVDPTLEGAARKAGLTQPALDIVGSPWLERAPVESIRALHPEDIKSIRSLFGESDLPNQFWPQAIQTLGLVGSGDDLRIFQRVLSYSLPPVNANSDSEAIQRMRALLQTKLAAPEALGILANREKSNPTVANAAVDILISTARTDQAEKLVGPASAFGLSKSAVEALAIADTPRARDFVGAVFNKSVTGPIAPLSPTDLNALKLLSDRVQMQGVDAVVHGGRL